MTGVKVIGRLALLLATFVLASYHAGVFPKPPLEHASNPEAQGEWIDKSTFGIHQLILSGDEYGRGLKAGALTKHLLVEQERVLVTQLRRWLPNEIATQAMVVAGSNWFRGAEKYFEPWTTLEMLGVSRSAPREYDYLADGFTRQIAYHGLHEVGQLMVDQGGEGMGCTVAAVPWKNSWIIGRNFDFEGGEIFDSEKIMKWVFPERGYAFVSVIWAGMVGAVTGVNEHGLYLSMNSAGSRDFRRIGTPSTLVLLKALQYAKTAGEALEILRDETMFITDIFVLADAKAGIAYRIEKSPQRTEIEKLTGPSIVTNHLQSQVFHNDPVNRYRREELTSQFRYERGTRLLTLLQPQEAPTPAEAETRVLKILRDKGEDGGRPLHLGNRRAIDALIATHAIVYNGIDRVLSVSQGPGLAGAFTGFDLEKSFRERRPVETRRLPADAEASPEMVASIRASVKAALRLQALARNKECGDGGETLAMASRTPNHNSIQHALGDWYACKGDSEKARESWRKALDFKPAYARDVRILEEKLRK